MNEDAVPCQASWFHNDAQVQNSEDRKCFPGRHYIFSPQVISTPKCLMLSGPKDSADPPNPNSACEFRLAIRDLEITDDGSWAVEVVNDLGRVRDQCRLTLKGA